MSVTPHTSRLRARKGIGLGNCSGAICPFGSDMYSGLPGSAPLLGQGYAFLPTALKTPSWSSSTLLPWQNIACLPTIADPEPTLRFKHVKCKNSGWSSAQARPFSGRTLPCGDCLDTPVFSNSPRQGPGETHIVASILHLLQGWWATPPATLAVCQLTYRHRLLVISSVQCQSNPSLPSLPFGRRHSRGTPYGSYESSKSQAILPRYCHTGSRLRRPCVLPSAQAPPRSLSRVGLTYDDIEVSSCHSGVLPFSTEND